MGAVVERRCCRASRADKTTVELDVVADDAINRTVGRAVEDGIEAASSLADFVHNYKR
jgi:hypothetical protein